MRDYEGLVVAKSGNGFKFRSFQMKPSNLADVLKNDRAQLRSMYQPSMVKEQLQALYREYDQLGEVGCCRPWTLCS